MKNIATDQEFGTAISGKNGNLTLVDFHASWCGPCKMLAPVVEEIARRHAGKLDVVKVDADELQTITAKYGVRGIPTLMLFKDGVPAATKVGVASLKQVEEFVGAYLN